MYSPDGSPPILEVNGVDDIDHVSIDNMNVSDMDDDAPAAPPVTARRSEAAPSRQPRPPSGRQLLRSQPPPMLQRKARTEAPMPSSPPASSPSTTAPRAEVLDEELTPMQREFCGVLLGFCAPRDVCKDEVNECL